jgi:hypothetical protein
MLCVAWKGLTLVHYHQSLDHEKRTKTQPDVNRQVYEWLCSLLDQWDGILRHKRWYLKFICHQSREVVAIESVIRQAHSKEPKQKQVCDTVGWILTGAHQSDFSLILKAFKPNVTAEWLSPSCSGGTRFKSRPIGGLYWLVSRSFSDSL